MAAWTPIDTNNLLPGEPWTSAKANAVYENPTAMAEGASGAPRINGLAIARNTDLPVLTVTASDAYEIAAAADSVNGTTTTTSASYVELREITIVAVTGTVRFTATHRVVELSAAESDLRIKKNGVVQNTWSTSNTSATTRTLDLAVIPTDVITWEHKANPGGVDPVTSVASATNGTASDGYGQIVPLIQLSLL